MTNIEKKQELWDKILKKYKHLESYCKIEVVGLENNDIYFHPKFILDDSTYISSQCDVGNNNQHIYALNFTMKSDNDSISTEIWDDLLEPVIIGYYTNKQVVIIALDVLIKLKNHRNQLNNYITGYIHNILVGNSVNEITREFINELNTTNQLINFMQKELK